MPYLRLPSALWAQGLVAGLAAVLLVSLGGALGWTQSLERQTLDGLFGARGPRFPHPKIIIVVVDNESVARANQWPYPRRLYAQIVRALHQSGARTIAFDTLFPTLSERPAEDAEFVRACREAGNVVPAMVFHLAGTTGTTLPVNLPGANHGLEKRFELSGHGSCLDAVWTSAAMSPLRQGAKAMGHVTVFPEPDGTLRRIPHVICYRLNTYPSLALAAATAYEGATPADIVAANRSVSWKEKGTGSDKNGARHVVPLDEHGEALINWVGSNNSFPTFSANDLLDGNVRSSAIQDSLVFIGVTAAGAYEQRATPFSPNQPAVEMQANAADDILSRRPLTECTFTYRWVLFIAFSILCGLAATRLGWGSAVWFSLLCGALWLHSLIMLHANQWVPCGAILVSGALAWMMMTVVAYRREWKENARADIAMDALARGGALLATSGDMDELRRVICNTAREALNAQEVHLVFDGERVVHEERDLIPAIEHIAHHVAQSNKLCRQPLDNQTGIWLRKNRDGHLPEVVSQGIGPYMAAPLPHRNESEPHTVHAPGAPRGGVLVALRKPGQPAFNLRDVTLMETFAEQAALAVANLEYYELLRGEIELADQNLVQTNALLASESAKLTAAVEGINTALIVTDDKGGVVFHNAVTTEVLRDIDLRPGVSLIEHLTDGGMTEVAVLCEEALLAAQAGEPISERRCETRRQMEITGAVQALTPSLLSAQATPLLGADGQFIGLMLAVADITAQRELEKMKSDFVSFVAHELRSPLTSILGYASLLQNSSDRIDAANRTIMTEAILRQGTRLNRLIGELLDISRIESGKALDMRPAAIDLASICQAAISSQRAALADKPSHQFEFRGPAALTLEGDADRIEQILVNLLSNAVKYSPRGGLITVEAEEQDNKALVRVQDNGLGMTEEQIASLFQKFYRTPEARRLGIKGTGLGLYLVRELVAAHGGTITVDSVPNKGTTFNITLPKVFPSHEAAD